VPDAGGSGATVQCPRFASGCRTTVVAAAIGVLVVALVVRGLVLTKRTRAAEELAHPGIAHETLERIIDELEALAEHDHEMRSRLHEQ
jgi:hypothetical protein